MPSHGRAEQIAAFYTQHAHRIRRTVASQVSAPTAEIIDDACQDAWTILLRRDDIALDDRGVAWLVTVAIRNAWRMSSPARVVAMGAFRGESYDLLELHEPVSDQLPIDAQVLDRDQRLADLATLKPRERRDLYLHALGFTYQEIASITASSHTAVNRRLFEGRAQLRRLAHDRDETGA